MSHGKDAARDLRYGRRGGAWKADDVEGAPKGKAGFEEKRCPVCRLTYRYDPDKGEPSHCGILYCRAVTEWTPIEWEGRARMAHARQAADLELDRLDLLALERSERAAS